MRRYLLCTALLTGGGLTPTHAATFSVDYQGPTAGSTPVALSGIGDSFAGTAIDGGAILTTTPPGPPGPNPPLPGPLPAPGIVVDSTAVPGTAPFGHLGLVTDRVEVDALSYGRDLVSQLFSSPDANFGPGNVPVFSVDEFAAGIPGSPAPPNVATEGATGAGEAAADVFRYLGPYGPFAPGPVFGNTAIIDGDGLPPFGGPGTGLIEPNPPLIGEAEFDEGDNLDALDINTTREDLVGPIFFSLDAAFGDPLEGGPAPNSGSAVSNGFVGGDVLVSGGGGAPALFIPAPALGLDLVGGAAGQEQRDSDDLDALALFENGDGVASPGAPGSGLDEILFSVRRGSAVIGMPDSLFGAPIEEGDILTVPLPTAMGGVSPFPQIFIPAEALGLQTIRSGGGTFYPGVPNPAWQGEEIWADDLDALDVVPEPSSYMLVLAAVASGFAARRRYC